MRRKRDVLREGPKEILSEEPPVWVNAKPTPLSLKAEHHAPPGLVGRRAARERGLRFRFSIEEACAIRDALETLIETYPCSGACRMEPDLDCDCGMEDGLRAELEMLRFVSDKIGRRIGVVP